MIPRLFIQSELSKGAQIYLSDAQSHYLSHVLRVQTGDDVLLFNGQDGEWRSPVTQIGKKQVVLQVSEQTRQQEKKSEVCLCFAPVKKDCTDLIIQKATELGVGKISFVRTKRTNTTKINMQRMNLLAIEAAEQSERLDVPEINDSQTLNYLLQSWDKTRPLYYLSERQDAAKVSDFSARCAFLVGPEGGFEDQELLKLSQCPFAKPIHLGRRILRAETACIAAMVLWNEWNGWQQ